MTDAEAMEAVKKFKLQITYYHHTDEWYVSDVDAMVRETKHTNLNRAIKECADKLIQRGTGA